MSYVYLALAIVFEVTGTLSLKASEGFSKLVPSVIVVLSYSGAFYFMSVVMKTLPMGIVYAVWSGLGIVLISTLGYFLFKQKLDLPAICGLALILAGVVVINVFSKSASH